RGGGGAGAGLGGTGAAPPPTVPQMGAPEQEIAPIRVPAPAGRRRPAKSAFRLARPSDRG
ncbi:MFS transporter, partial [Streptomyces sp. NPDC059556]